MTLRLRTDDLVWERLDDEIVALDLRTSRYLRVNASGTDLWGLLVSGAESEDLIASVTATYGVDRGRAQTDVDRFIATLDERGLIDRSS